MLFPGWVQRLADVMFFMAETGRPSSHVKYIGRISEVWEETLMSTLLPATYQHTNILRYVHNFLWFHNKKSYFRKVFTTLGLQRHHLRVRFSWICDYVHVVTHWGKLWPRPAKQQRWPRKSGSFRQYCRDKEMSEEDDPFLEGLLPPPLLRQWWHFHVCVGLWRPDVTCILSGISRWYRYLSCVSAWTRGSFIG